MESYGRTCHIRVMARDRYRIELNCPQCRTQAFANVSENDGQAFLRDPEFTVEEMPDGFRVRDETNSVMTTTFECVKCGREAESK